MPVTEMQTAQQLFDRHWYHLRLGIVAHLPFD